MQRCGIISTFLSLYFINHIIPNPHASRLTPPASFCPAVLQSCSPAVLQSWMVETFQFSDCSSHISPMNMEDKIQLIHPEGRTAVRINKEKYEILKKEILSALKTKENRPMTICYNILSMISQRKK